MGVVKTTVANFYFSFFRSSQNQITIEVERVISPNQTALWEQQSIADSELTTDSLCTELNSRWRYSRTSMVGQEGSDLDYDSDMTTTLLGK